jgi:hypothetical protein
MVDDMPVPESILDCFQNCYDAPSEGELREFEIELSVYLPADYRAFLLAWNAPWCSHALCFRVLNPGPFVEGGVLDDLCGILDQNNIDNSSRCIRWNVEIYRDRIPNGLLPIGSSISDPICLGIAPENYGQVFLWDSAEEGSDDNLFLVAKSFTEFLTRLYPDPLEAEFYQESLPIFQAVERGQRAAVEAYLADGGKVECRNDDGQTLLMCAARTSWPRIVRLLLDHGADPNAQDGDELTPLYYAVMRHSLDSVKLLLAAGSDPRYRDPLGRSMLKLAKKLGAYRISCTLKERLRATREQE